jgi:HAD superfamily hydrolase (TIGR01458 family)
MYEAVLVDLSGTIHIGKDAIPGAIQACRSLISSGLKVMFLTNTSKISSKSLLHQLREIGFDESAIPETIDGRPTIMTSVGATRQYLIQNNLRPFCLVEDELIEQDFQGVSMTDPNCVLVGLAPSKFNYERMNEAYRLLLNLRNNATSNVPHLISINRATHYKDSDHQLSLGPGGFISLLEQAAGVTAHIVGKPSQEFYNAALSALRVENPSDAIMIGDDVVGDIKGALDSGLGGAILVETGKYVAGDESGEKTEGVVPTFKMDSIVEAVHHICFES